MPIKQTCPYKVPTFRELEAMELPITFTVKQWERVIFGLRCAIDRSGGPDEFMPYEELRDLIQNKIDNIPSGVEPIL